MIANAGAMGLNWRELSLSDYFEALEAYNAMHDPKAQDEAKSASEGLKRFMKAHGVTNG